MKTRSKKAAQMHNLVKSTGALFAAIQRVDAKVSDYVIAKTTELNAFADQMEAWTAIEADPSDEGSVN